MPNRELLCIEYKKTLIHNDEKISEEEQHQIDKFEQEESERYF